MPDKPSTRPAKASQKPQKATESKPGPRYSDSQKEPYEAKYRYIWGEDPPPNYIDRVIDSGLNVKEMEAHERAKPAFLHFAPLGLEEQAQHRQAIQDQLGGQSA